MTVFFYGLFMNVKLLETKGVKATNIRVGFVDGFALQIGERATLVRSLNSRAYGAIMNVAADEAAKLYAEDSVADYLPEPVSVELMDGTEVEAICYNLPGPSVTRANKDYAESLWQVASKLGLPDSYLDEIRQAGSSQ